MRESRARLGAVLRELRELGVDELFLDGITAEEARALLGQGGAGAAAAASSAAPSADQPGETPSWREVLDGGEKPDAGEQAASSAAKQAAPHHPGRSPGLVGDAPAAPTPPAAPAAGLTTPGSLTVLQQKAAPCTRCRLAETRTQVVFGRGSAGAEVVVVGEAPGSEEDRTGLPFVGPAGKLLDLLLLSVGFDRESVYICNVLKCRPPNNRNPLPDEVEQCSGWLHGQLEAIRPKVLLAVGKFAGQTLTGTESPIGRLRGQVHSFRGIPVVATYHPAYLLRTPSATRKTWQDFQLMRRVLDEST